jgi:hypothetical protein
MLNVMMVVMWLLLLLIVDIFTVSIKAVVYLRMKMVTTTLQRRRMMRVMMNRIESVLMVSI